MANDTTPQGIPFNFHGVLDAVLIPRVITSDRQLSPAARLLWGIIRQRAWKDGWCRSSDADLAGELGVHPRKIRAHCAQLSKAGYLLTVQRSGTTPERALLLTPAFKVRVAGSSEPVGHSIHTQNVVAAKSASTRPAEIGRPPGRFRPPPPAEIGRPYKEEVLSSGSSYGGLHSAQVVTADADAQPPGAAEMTVAAAHSEKSEEEKMVGLTIRPSLEQLTIGLELAKQEGCSLTDAMRKVQRPVSVAGLTHAAKAVQELLDYALAKSGNNTT